jgi:hypothetical protein
VRHEDQGAKKPVQSSSKTSDSTAFVISRPRVHRRCHRRRRWRTCTRRLRAKR